MAQLQPHTTQEELNIGLTVQPIRDTRKVHMKKRHFYPSTLQLVKEWYLFDYGKSLDIPEGVGMPITVFLVGYETGFSFPDRELLPSRGGG